MLLDFEASPHAQRTNFNLRQSIIFRLVQPTGHYMFIKFKSNDLFVINNHLINLDSMHGIMLD